MRDGAFVPDVLHLRRKSVKSMNQEETNTHFSRQRPAGSFYLACCRVFSGASATAP